MITKNIRSAMVEIIIATYVITYSSFTSKNYGHHGDRRCKKQELVLTEAHFLALQRARCCVRGSSVKKVLGRKKPG